MEEKLTKASSADGKVSRRRRAPADSGFCERRDRHRLVEDDRLEAVERPERPGPGLLGQQDGGTAARVAEAEGALEPEVVDGR